MGRNFDHTHFLVLSYSSTLAFMNWKYSRVLPLFCPTTAPAVLTIFVGRGGATRVFHGAGCPSLALSYVSLTLSGGTTKKTLDQNSNSGKKIFWTASPTSSERTRGRDGFREDIPLEGLLTDVGISTIAFLKWKYFHRAKPWSNDGEDFFYICSGSAYGAIVQENSTGCDKEYSPFCQARSSEAFSWCTINVISQPGLFIVEACASFYVLRAPSS